MMRKAHRLTLRAAVGVLVAGGIVVVATPETASATLPAVCSSGGGNVHNWTGTTSNDWDVATNWTNGVPDGPGEVACIDGSAIVVQDGAGDADVSVAELHMDGSAWLQITDAGVFVNGSATSIWSTGTSVTVTDGRLGGTARIEANGQIEFFGTSVLTSLDAAGGTTNTAPVDGVLELPDDGSGITSDVVVEGVLQLFTDYHLDVSGEVDVGDGALISADWGTSLTIEAEGSLNFYGSGGWYQGNAVSGRTKAVVLNRGLIGKFVGGTTSVVDADYSQEGAGHVTVVCCSTLAIAGKNIISGSVASHHGIATGQCGLNKITTCGGSTDPAVDEMSLKLFMPVNQGGTAQVQELGDPARTVDSRAVGNQVLANIDGFAGDPADPAILTLRYSQADVMATPLDELYVAHVDDVTGAMTKVPDCVDGEIPAGDLYCIDRALLLRDAQNTTIRVLTTITSRWHIRRVPADETFEQTAPQAATGLKATLAPPGDGSVVKLTWVHATDDGGAAPVAYRIYRDGKLVKTTEIGGQLTAVKNNGPGLHTFQVVAVNVVGSSPKSDPATITLDKLSKPRQVAAVRGPAGGARTAGATWQPPGDAGGYAIKSYQVAAFTLGGRLVKSVIVGATARKAFLALAPGQYKLKVRAKNVDKWGPFSTATSPVSPR
jgi:hypothetical protein